MLKDGKLNVSLAQCLGGRLQFAENQFAGRMARRALAAVTKHSVLKRTEMSFAWRCHLEDFVGELFNGPPRALRTHTLETRTFLHRRLCFEPDRSEPVGVGCVLVGPGGVPLEFIAGSLMLAVCEMLGMGARKTTMLENEMYALW